MHYHLLDSNQTTRTFMIVFDKGERVMENLLAFAVEQKLTAASFAGLGAFSSGALAFFDRESLSYLPISVEEQVEVLNITGNVTLFNGEPRIHAHTLLSRPDGSTLGGHFTDGVVWPTLELTLTGYPATLERLTDEESTLPLIGK